MKKLKDMYLKLKEETAAVSIMDMAPIAIAFVVITIVIAVGGLIVQQLHTDQVGNSSAANITAKGL